MNHNNNGASVVIEYILSLVITSMLFTIIILLSSNTIRMTNQVVMNEQFGIIAGDVANRITLFSSNIYNNQYADNYYHTTDLRYTTIMDLPPATQGDQYIVDVNYFPGNKTGFVKVTYGLNYNINRTTLFYSNVTITDSRFYSDNDVKICYPDSDGNICLLVS